jgi:hypothetical protein
LPSLIIRDDAEVPTDVVGEYEATRAELLRRGLVAGGLAVGASAVPAFLGVARALAQGGEDAPLLRGALEIEHTAALAYEGAARSGRLEPRWRALAERFGGQEREHADVLGTALERLGGTPPPGPAGVAGLSQAAARGQRALLEFIIGVEEMILAAYHRDVQRLADSRLLHTVASIMCSEGQHLVVLRQALGRDPVPRAFETGAA